MEPQILIPAQLAAFASGFIKINQSALPATIQVEGLGSGEIVAINSLSSFATALLTLSANVDDGDTVTIGPRTYTFQDILTDVDGNVKRDGISANTSLDNLILAINLGFNSGNYAASTTLNTEVSAGEPVVSGEMIVTAKEPGDAGVFAVSTVSSNASWGNNIMKFQGAPIFEGGSAVELTETNNTIAINSPIEIQAVKGVTASQVLVKVAYGNQV